MQVTIACVCVVQDISSEENTVLSVVSYIGCGISIVCLLIVIIVLLYYRLVVSKVCITIIVISIEIHY